MRPSAFRAFILGVIGLIATGCATIRPATGGDTRPRLAIISAFDAELVRLRAAAEITSTRVVTSDGSPATMWC